MKYMKLLTLSLMLLVSFGYAGIVHALSTTAPASQVVSYYNTAETDAYVQVTNTNLGSGVAIHIQVLDENCDEVDFFDSLTPLDTNVYNIDGIVGAGTRGIVIINSVAAVNDFNPIDFPFLIGTTTLVDDDGGPSSQKVGYNFNNLGRQLVGGVWELHQPDNIMATINTFTEYNRGEFISLAWADVFAGGYIAIGGSALTTNPLVGVFIIDDNEVRDSCGQFSVECISELGPTTGAPSFLGPFDSAGEEFVCDKSNEDLGLVQLLDIVSTDNYVALTGGNDLELAGLDYAVDVSDQVTEVPVEDCSDAADNDGDGDVDCDDADCDGTAACAGEVPGDDASCSDGEDNDGDGDVDCADADCDGVGFCESPVELTCDDELDNDGDGLTDCDDPACAAFPACDTSGGSGGGGGGGCSVATAATGLGSMANALVLLIPAFGIGARRIRRRLSK